MTTEEIEYIFNEIGESTDIITPLLGVQYLTFSKLETRTPEIENWRFNFDTTNEVVWCYPVREYKGDVSKLEEDTYDIYNDKYYKYLLNENGEKLADCFDFETLVIIAPKPVKE